MRLAPAALQRADPLAVFFVRPKRSVSPPQRGYRRFFDVLLPAVEQRGCDVVVATGLGNVAALQTLDHDGELLFRTSLDLSFSRHLASWRRPCIITYDPVQFWKGALHLLEKLGGQTWLTAAPFITRRSRIR